MKNLTALAVVFCLLFLLMSLLPVHGETEVYERVVRLHVLANSDSEEDQALKLLVRDSVLAETKALFEKVSSREEAEEVLRQNLDRIGKVAKERITAEGYSYPVTVALCHETYPEKSYEALCFPSGEYLSLQVRIGEAEGQNWWCVLFPPLCLSAASARDAEDSFAAVGLTKDQYSVITETEKPTYKVRFKLLESIEDTFG